jgi:hypothetical protein
METLQSMKNTSRINLGVLLTYKYTFEGLSAVSLKGSDMVLWNCIQQAGLKAVLHPVVLKFHQKN